MYFLKLAMEVYLSAKFEVSSIILTGFRDVEGDFTPPPPKKKKPTQIRAKN